MNNSVCFPVKKKGGMFTITYPNFVFLLKDRPSVFYVINFNGSIPPSPSHFLAYVNSEIKKSLKKYRIVK